MIKQSISLIIYLLFCINSVHGVERSGYWVLADKVPHAVGELAGQREACKTRIADKCGSGVFLCAPGFLDGELGAHKTVYRSGHSPQENSP